MEEYHYIQSGLNNIYLTNGVDISTDSDGNEIVRIHDVLGLHRAIAFGIISTPGRLTGREARFLRHVLDWSQKKLAEIFGISNYQTVLNWEKDVRPIEAAKDRLLRMLVYSYYAEEGRVIYDKINELADIDSARVEKERLVFEEREDVWYEAIAA